MRFKQVQRIWGYGHFNATSFQLHTHLISSHGNFLIIPDLLTHFVG